MRSSRMRTARSSSCLLGGVCLSACWDTPPRPGPEHPYGVGLETPRAQAWTPPMGVGLDIPQSDPSTFPLGVCLKPPPPRPDPSTSSPGCGPGDPPCQTPQPPPWVWAWRPPLWKEFLTHASENITLPQLRCGR